MCVFCRFAYVCTTYAYGSRRGQKRAPDPQVTVELMNARNWTGVLCKSNKYSKPLSHLPTCVIKKKKKVFFILIVWHYALSDTNVIPNLKQQAE